MNELKTLNNIEPNIREHLDFKEKECPGNDFCGYSQDDMYEAATEFYTKKLKQEVIKWYHRSDDDKHRFIVKFFNLTDEEIKNGSNRC